MSAVSGSSVLSGASNWLASTFTAIQNSQNSGGIMGALQNMGDGSLSSYLSQSNANSNNLALISQSSVTNSTSFYAQVAAANAQERMQQKLQEQLDLLQRTQAVAPTNNLDPMIFLGGGVTIDTVNNIMTMSDGTQYDTVSGAKYVDPASILQMANGSYLNTKTNILTLGDGTQIDNVTHQKVSTTA